MSARKVLLLFILPLLFTACKNKVQKGYEFIKEYNDAAPLMKSGLLYRTEAKINGERILEEIIIDIDYDLSLRKVDCETNIGAKMLPRNVYYTLIKGEAGELINSGAIINLTFRSLDNYILKKTTLDKKMMQQLLSENQTHIIDLDFSLGKNPELVKILARFNKSLPIENQDDKTKLIKLKLDTHNNIICITEVPDNFAVILKNPESKSRLEESILERENDQIFIDLKKTYNVSKLIYRFQNSKGELIDQVSF
jgi:hypothetical protein